MNSEDFETVTKQLGRPPVGARLVVARDLEGHPVVIEVDPLVNGVPFPTTYWLTCPTLRKLISRLECQGLISLWEKDEKVVRQLEKDHLRYRETRFALLQKCHPQWRNLPAGKLAVLKMSGIGGIRDFTHIKCMHLHYAHFLADDNVVGRMIDKLLPV